MHLKDNGLHRDMCSAGLKRSKYAGRPGRYPCEFREECDCTEDNCQIMREVRL